MVDSGQKSESGQQESNTKVRIWTARQQDRTNHSHHDFIGCNYYCIMCVIYTTKSEVCNK